jgi:hypothetical protein
MPITVTLPDGTEQSFPDGMTESEISSQLGGRLVPTDPDPATALRAASGIPVDPEPTPGMAADALARFRRGGAVAVGQTLQAIPRLGYAVGQALGLDSGVAPEQRETRLAEVSPMFRFGGELVEGAREAFATDPSRDSSILSTIVESAGGMIPTIGAGAVGRLSGVGARLLGGAQYGLSAGEQGAQEAIAAGRPDLATPAFAAFAPLGALTEGLLGVAPRLFTGALARSVPGAVAKGAASEAAQESLEQLGQNVIASKGLAYDPNRPLSEGLAESAIAGAVLGGGFSSIPALLDRRSRPKLRSYEKAVQSAGFDLANTVFDPAPKILVNERAVAELAAAREELAKGPNLELEARLPALQEAASLRSSVEVSLDSGTGQLTVHLPAIKNVSHLRDILREERQHLTLATPEGKTAVLDFVKSNPLQPAEVEALRAYIQRPEEADDAYRSRLTDEYLAKLNRGSWWKRWTGEAVALFKKTFGWELSNEQAGRLVLRNLRKAVGSAPVAGTRESAAPVTRTPWRNGVEFRLGGEQDGATLAVAPSDLQDGTASADLEVRGKGAELFGGKGDVTRMYRDALRWAATKGLGWKSDPIASRATVRMYERLTESGVPFRKEGEQWVATAEDLKRWSESAVRESAVPVTPEQDKQYLDAVARGDMATAQKMVDDAAKRAGYTVGPVWHGTGDAMLDGRNANQSEGQFNVFKPSRIGALGPGIYFAPDKDNAEEYAKRFRNPRLIRAFLRVKNPLKGRTTAEVGDKLFSQFPAEDDAGTIRKLLAAGYDAVWSDTPQATKFGTVQPEIAVYDPSQIKSADPVTKDDAGNVIPLSQRFNQESPDIRYSAVPLTPEQAFPGARIERVATPDPSGRRVAFEDGVVRVFDAKLRGDDPELAREVAKAGVSVLPDPFLSDVVGPILRNANLPFAAREAKRTGLTGAPLARHLLALELEDWRIREASGIFPFRTAYRLAQALRLALSPANERTALRAVRRLLEASAEQYRSGEKVVLGSEDQDQIFVDRNRRMVSVVGPLVRSLRARLSESRDLYSKQFRDTELALQRLATEARTRRLAEGVEQGFNPRSAKFLDDVTDAGVAVTDQQVEQFRAYQTELRSRALARKLEALEAAQASLANIARIDPRLDVASLQKRVARLEASIGKATPEQMERALIIRADRKAALDRDAAARVLDDPQMAEWVAVLDQVERIGIRDSAPTAELSADLAEADNYFALQFDEFAQRVEAELAAFETETFQPKIRALRDRLTALRKTEGEAEVAMREVLQAARGKADRSGSSASREDVAALREIDAQILRFAFGLAQADPKTEAGKLRDALIGGEDADWTDLARVERVSKEVGLTPEIVSQVLRLTAQYPEFKLVIEDLFDSSEKAVREHVLTTIELIEDVYAEGKASLAAAQDDVSKKAVKQATAAKADEIARRALARMRRTRNGIRREVREAESAVFDLSAELLQRQTLAGLARAGEETLGPDRPHVRRMVYMAPGKGGEILAAFGDQPEVRIAPDQIYAVDTVARIGEWLTKAHAALRDGSVDIETQRGLRVGIPRAASFLDNNFVPGELEKTLRPSALLDTFAASWLRTPNVLSKLVPGLWARRIDQTRADRDKAVRKANAIQQRTATKRRKLILDAASSLGLDIQGRSGDPGILFDAYNEVAHQLRQHGSGVEAGQRFWLRSLRDKDGRITPELLNLIRFDRATGRELQSIEELRLYGGIRMKTGRGREIVRPSAPTGDIGLARLPKTQPLEDLVAAYEGEEATRQRAAHR